MIYEIDSPPKKKFDYQLHTINLDGSVSIIDKRSVIESEHPHSLYGYTRILEDEPLILVGTRPPSSAKHFFRLITNRFHEFPSQSSKQAAQIDHLTSKLLHLVLPPLSDNKFYSPNSIGYTKLVDGYAQVLENVKARGPRYTDDQFDYHEFKKAQIELKELESCTGFEHWRLIDGENRLGLPNIKRDDENNRWVHLNTLSTSNNVLHTDTFLKTITDKRNLFTLPQLNEIFRLTEQYQKIQHDFDLNYHPQRQLTDSLRYLTLGSTEIIVQGLSTITKKPFTSLWELVNPYYQQQKIFEGIERAWHEGLITEAEYDQSETKIKEDLLKKGIFSLMKTGVLGFAYAGVGGLTHIPEFYLYTQIGQDAELSLISLLTSTIAAGATFTGARVAGGILRYPTTHLVGALTRTNLNTAAKISLIPVIGDNIALVANLYAAHKGDKLLTHYAVRDQLAKLSTILPVSWKKPIPLGGWGTDAEAEMIKRWGKKLEHLIEN